jgi:hypothetical protein
VRNASDKAGKLSEAVEIGQSALENGHESPRGYADRALDYVGFAVHRCFELIENSEITASRAVVDGLIVTSGSSPMICSLPSEGSLAAEGPSRFGSAIKSTSIASGGARFRPAVSMLLCRLSRPLETDRLASRLYQLGEPETSRDGREAVPDEID